MSGLAGRLAGGLAVLLALAGCGTLDRISEGSYRTAVADGTVAELRRLGYRADERPSCTLPRTGSPSVVRVSCHGRLADRRPVTVTGIATEARTDHPREQYVISVAGREVLRTGCLDHGCKDR